MRKPRRAYVLLPHWYGPRRDPPLPLVVSPHARGVPARDNARVWGDLPARDRFAVVNPEGQGRRFALYSWGDPGQIGDLARREVGGTPWNDPRDYALRSPLDDARAIARSGVPLQLWWSTQDRIVVDQAEQSGLLYRRIEQLHPRASLRAFVGTWVHTAEMRWNRRLPVALRLLGVLGPPVAGRSAGGL